MSAAAQRSEQDELMVGVSYRAPETEAGLALKQLAAERLAAHRSRKAALQAQEAELQARVEVRRDGARKETRNGASRIREAVAARYEQSLSYREFLAAEGKRALEQAQAEAEVAARNARAIAEAQKELIAELEQWKRPTETGPRLETKSGNVQQSVAVLGEVPGLRVQMIEELGTMPRIEMRREAVVHSEETEGELQELEYEIAFRLSPGFEDHTLEMQAIPGNIIEFPRPMVATRKARPRLAEGPLRAEAEPEPQLRIFEVEAEQISVQPEVMETTAAPDWQNLTLDAASAPQATTPLAAQAHYTTQPQTASLDRRLMAAAVDACLIGAAFIGFASVVVRVGHGLHGLALPKLGAVAAVSLVMFFVMYGMLFFSLNEATPGMRYARIGLCTFGDDNPTRKAMRIRVLTTLLAACPVGLGLLWALMDSDRLGWQDRISRMYQRAY